MSALRKKPLPARWQPAFWDTSAIIPLCCWQLQTQTANRAYRLFPKMVVWWATGVEGHSALQRLEREQQLTAQEKQQALRTLGKYRTLWTEVAPLDEVRNTAEQLLGKHGLRAADALQLAAALVWCHTHPKGKTFIGADSRLLDAAAREGFTVVRL